MAAAVSPIAATRDQAALLHLVQETDDVARIQTQHIGQPLLAVPCIYADEEEIGLLADHRVKVSHNPAAALKIMGLPVIVPMLERGVDVGLGTDAGASNNRNSMVDEMWLAGLLQKGIARSPLVMPAQQVLEMATLQSARCLGWEAEIGSVEVGKKADLCVVDPSTANMLPLHDPIASLVSCMKTENIEDTMCDGVWLSVTGGSRRSMLTTS